jgi:hypothetical protein
MIKLAEVKIDETHYCNRSLLLHFGCAIFFPQCNSVGMAIPPCRDYCKGRSIIQLHVQEDNKYEFKKNRS